MKFTLKNASSLETVCKKSRFICFVYPLNDKGEVKDYLTKIRQQYPDARHICYAFQIDNHSGMGDDGEPSGTAGKPIFVCLQHQQLTNCLAIVVRYFGGIKLGAGGLIRAYSGAVKACVQQADLKELTQNTEFSVWVDFALESKLRYFCQQHQVAILSYNYHDQLELKCQVEQSKFEKIKPLLVQLCAGALTLTCQQEAAIDQQC